MQSASVVLPDLDRLNVTELKALLRKQHAELLSQKAELLSHKTEIESLKLLILKLRRMQFGQKSEKRARQIEQLELWVEELEATNAQLSCVAEKKSKRSAAAPKAPRVFPEHLPRETRTIAPREDACPDCGGELKHLGEDVSETLELAPVRFRVIRTVRPKLACACCDTIVQAPAESRSCRFPGVAESQRPRGSSVSHAARLISSTCGANF
jgi:hypothetical protein